MIDHNECLQIKIKFNAFVSLKEFPKKKLYYRWKKKLTFNSTQLNECMAFPWMIVITEMEKKNYSKFNTQWKQSTHTYTHTHTREREKIFLFNCKDARCRIESSSSSYHQMVVDIRQTREKIWAKRTGANYPTIEVINNTHSTLEPSLCVSVYSKMR